METRTGEEPAARGRLDKYLIASGLDRLRTRVVPLTGDASDRSYFRVIPERGPSLVLALHAGPIEFDDAAVRRTSRRCSREMPLPVPAVARPLRRARHARAAGSRRRDAAGAPRRGDAGASTRRCTGRPWRSSTRCSAAARELAIDRLPALQHRVRRREADVGARLLRQAFPRGVPRRGAARAGARRARGGVAPRSSRSWRPSRACSVTATTTAAT